MQEPKKDESVKTGLKIAGQKNTTEKDPDDLVHEQPSAEQPEPASESDIDELVHQQPSSPPEDNLEERDPDDLVHEAGNDEAEEV
ncbi:MAG TPA: hypothetical protein VK498_04175 [Ferruginibacter sp.]|nr:hypothetical protein [Ferruginibacter sp.]